MTREQLSAIIEDDLGYEFGQKIALEEVSSLALSTDMSLSPNPVDTRFEFDDSLDLLYIWKIKTNEDDTIEYLSSQPNDCISFSTIEAVHLVSPIFISGGFGHRAV